MTIYLTRHTQYANPRNILPGRLPVELSEEGVTEAERLQLFFQDKNISKIYSSAVHRCKQTSETIANNNISIEYDQRLLESFSAYQGYWIEDFKHYWIHRHEVGGEGHQDIQNRMVSFWQEKIVKSEIDGNIIICSHGDPLYFLYQYLADQPLLPEWTADGENKTPEDYIEKGSVLPVELHEDVKVKIGEMISQEELNN